MVKRPMGLSDVPYHGVVPWSRLASSGPVVQL